MKNRNKTNVIRWNFFFYLMEFLYMILVGVILVPLYLSHIPKELYGYWLATGNILSMLILLNPGFSDIIQQRVSYSYGKNDTESIGMYSFSGVFLTFGFSVIILIVGFFIWFYMKELFIMPSGDLNELKNAFGLMLVGTFLTINYFSFSAISYAILSSRTVGVVNFIGNISGLFATLYLITHGYGVLSLGIASVVRGGVFLIGGISYIFYRFRHECIYFRVDFQCMKEMCSLSIYNFLGRAGQSLLSNTTSFLTAKFVSPIETSNLKFTQTVPEFGKIIVLRFLYSVTPVIPNVLAVNGMEYLRKQLLTLLFFLLSIIYLACIGFFLYNEQFINLWLGNGSYSGYWVNILVVILLFFSSINKVTTQLLLSLGDIKRSNKVLFAQAAIYLPIAIVMTKLYGIWGLLLTGIIIELLAFIFFFLPKVKSVLQLTLLDRKGMLLELCKLFFVGGITLTLGLLMRFTDCNWGELLVEVLITTLLYFILLFLSSKLFKNLLIVYIKK